METTTKNKIKKITGIVVNVLLWLFVAFSVVITIIAVSASANKKNVPTLGGRCYLSVQSDSMNASKPEWVSADKPSGFKTGDLLIGKYISDDQAAIAALEIGDVITFEYDMNHDGVYSQGEYNTHRIVEIITKEDGSVNFYKTQGDNEAFSHGATEEVYASRIIAVYTGDKIGGIGGVITALSTPLGFGLCIVLPLGLFFGYELFVFIRTVMQVKNEGKKMITAADEELIKQRAVEEYLRMQREAQESAKAEQTNEEEI